MSRLHHTLFPLPRGLNPPPLVSSPKGLLNCVKEGVWECLCLVWLYLSSRGQQSVHILISKLPIPHSLSLKVQIIGTGVQLGLSPIKQLQQISAM